MAPGAFALAGLALLAAACGGDDGDDTFPGTVLVDGTPVAAGPEIDQERLTFKPEKLTVANGQAITFKNSETAIHTVTINGKNESGNMKKGAAFVWTAPGAGTYKITCEFHPQMRATITVQE